MHYVLILIGIWVVISFIYSKVKSESFLASLILVPLSLIRFFLEDAGKDSSFYKAEKEAKKQGRDDVLANIEATKGAFNSAAGFVNNAEEKIKNKED